MTGTGRFVVSGVPDLLAVIPIFVNTGAALIPALVAGLSSVLALLLKPRDLVRACKRKPHVPADILIVVGAGIGLG